MRIQSSFQLQTLLQYPPRSAREEKDRSTTRTARCSIKIRHEKTSASIRDLLGNHARWEVTRSNEQDHVPSHQRYNVLFTSKTVVNMVENPIQAGWKMEQGINLTAGLDWFVCKLLRDYNCWEKVGPVLISSSLKHIFFDSVLQNWFYSTLIWLFVSMNLMCGFCKIKKHSRIWSRYCIPKPNKPVRDEDSK
jgi:hypothetical protein